METFKWLFGFRSKIQPDLPDLPQQEPLQSNLPFDGINNEVHFRVFDHNALNQFAQMDKIMDSFLNSFVKSTDHILTDLSPPAPDELNPRDQLLKEPDSEILQENVPKNNQMWLFRSEEEIYSNPFTTYEKTFAPWNGFQLCEPQPRDSLLKKDENLDDLSSAEREKIFSEGPSYVDEYGGKLIGTNYYEQESNFRSLIGMDDTKRSFKSTSYSRVVRPNGSVEERRTYKDSTGKEEVTVTELEPDASAGSLLEEHDIFPKGFSFF